MPNETCDTRTQIGCCKLYCIFTIGVSLWIANTWARNLDINEQCDKLTDSAMGCHNFVASLVVSQFARAKEDNYHGKKTYQCNTGNSIAYNVVQLKSNGALPKELQSLIDSQPCNMTGIIQYEPYWKYQPASFNASTWSLLHPEKFPLLIPDSETVCVPDNADTQLFFWKQQVFNPKLGCQESTPANYGKGFLYGSAITASTFFLLFMLCRFLFCKKQPIFRRPTRSSFSDNNNFRNTLDTILALRNELETSEDTSQHQPGSNNGRPTEVPASERPSARTPLLPTVQQSEPSELAVAYAIPVSGSGEPSDDADNNIPCIINMI